MTRLIERYEAHYEMHEVPFGRTYHWYPTHIIIECDCGEKLRFDGINTITTCQCGADHSDIVRDIQEQEGPLRDQVTHPWLYGAQEQAEQHLETKLLIPRALPGAINDITPGLGDDVER
jgi:hypothetical protein